MSMTTHERRDWLEEIGSLLAFQESLHSAKFNQDLAKMLDEIDKGIKK